MYSKQLNGIYYSTALHKLSIPFPFNWLPVTLHKFFLSTIGTGNGALLLDIKKLIRLTRKVPRLSTENFFLNGKRPKLKCPEFDISGLHCLHCFSVYLALLLFQVSVY